MGKEMGSVLVFVIGAGQISWGINDLFARHGSIGVNVFLILCGCWTVFMATLAALVTLRR